MTFRVMVALEATITSLIFSGRNMTKRDFTRLTQIASCAG